MVLIQRDAAERLSRAVMMLLSSFVLGLVFGSFANVVIYRLKNGRNMVFGHSFCPDCKTTLKGRDLVPILSFLYLWGRCRYCDKKISWQYPVVEILSGFIWLGVFYQNFNNHFSPFGGSPYGGQFINVFYQIFVLSALLIVAVYDFKWKIIPDKIVYPAIVVASIYNLFNAFQFGNFEIFIWPLTVASIAFFFFFTIFYFSSGRAMGLGDAKLAFLIGLFLSPLPAVIAFTLAFIIGAASAIMLVGFGKKSFKSQIAFGPFLVIGAAFAFFLSDLIINFFGF